MPGYIKDVGGHKRMRMVQPGYNVDIAPPNKVILDSDDIGTLSLLYAGTFRFLRDGASPVTRQIASWSLSYIPLCTFQFSPQGTGIWNPVYVPGGSGSSIAPQRILVSASGISATILTNPAGPDYVDINWQAYRLVVA